MSTDSPAASHRLLVIDDNTSVHDGIRTILCGGGRNQRIPSSIATASTANDAPPAAAGFIIDSAFQGAEGLSKVQQALAAGQPYAVAFVDIRMPPGWDGIETATRLWRAQPDLQVVICTAYSDYCWGDMKRKLGMSDRLIVLKKPFDHIEVPQLAHALCEKWAMDQRLKAQVRQLDAQLADRTAELQAANAELQREVEERRRLEQALRGSQERCMKALEASPLPVALHDLNNLLMVIQGNTSLALERSGPSAPHHELLHTVAAAVDESTRLVRRLIAVPPHAAG